MRWLDGIIDTMDMRFSKLWEMGSLECCSPWGHKESDITEQLNKIRTSHLYNISGFACASEIRTRKLSKIPEE